MTLGERQELFSRLLPRLIVEAHRLGHEVRLKELQRSERQSRWNATHCGVCQQTKAHRNHPTKHKFSPIGIVNSLHRDCLAIDLVLTSKGLPLRYSEEYAELGKFWEGLHELCCWGGRFKRPDGGHFSITYQGRK